MSLSFKHTLAVWFNIDHRMLIKERDQLYRLFRRTKIAEDLLAYRQVRDLAHREIEEARHNYHYTRLFRITDPKDIWRELEHLGISSRKKSTAYHSQSMNSMLISGVSHMIKTLHQLQNSSTPWPPLTT